MIYDINTCLNSLSFIQISVAFNFGCIIMKNNPVVSLFKILTRTSYAKADNYMREFTPKLNNALNGFRKMILMSLPKKHTQCIQNSCVNI